MTVEDSIELTVKGCGVELYDIVNFKENDILIYRIYISSKDGIDLEKCSQVSRLISPIFDIHFNDSKKYHLEVSSPGIERKLTKPKHFILSIGQYIKIKDHDKNLILGTLADANDEFIKMNTDDNFEKIIYYNYISNAMTVYQW
jgi:ribosome maturation factor RimP